ncbi:hypothetical protein LEMLEM_LOCUS3603, partial [Lemmus lemmus]
GKALQVSENKETLVGQPLGEVNAGSLLAFCVFFSLGLHRGVLPILRVTLPSSVKTLWKPLHRHAEVCLQGESKSYQ